MRIRGRISNIFDRTLEAEIILAGILVISVTVIVGVDIVLRYFFDSAMGWVMEVSEYIILVTTFLAAAWILRNDQHVKMDLIISRLKPKSQFLLGIITSTMGFIICIILTWYGAKVTWDLFQSNYFTPTILELPKGIFTAFIFWGSLMLSIQFLRRVRGYVKNWKNSTVLNKGASVEM